MVAWNEFPEETIPYESNEIKKNIKKTKEERALTDRQQECRSKSMDSKKMQY